MEHQEEKTENINTKRIRIQSPSSSKSSSSIPLDLTLAILSKLPVESVLRFRCVSKLWSSITTDSYFISSFKTRPRLLMFFRKVAKLFVFSLSQHNQNPNKNEGFSYSSSDQPIDSYHISYPENCCFSDKTESVHGLICLQIYTNPIIWNPSMRQFLALPKPQVESWKDTTVFLGYDPTVAKHKLVCMPSHETCDYCRVLTLGSDKKSWRTVKTEHTHRPFNGHGNSFSGRCINGVLYYQAICGSHRFIMSFNVRSETFGVITYPWGGNYSFWKRLMMISYEGKLAFVGNIRSGKSIIMWVLEDAMKSHWCHRHYSPLSHYVGQDLHKQFKLIGITDDGELIYSPKTFFNFLYIIYIDPKRKTFSRVEDRGLVGDEGSSLGDRPQYIPNHIETLLSL